MSPACETPDDVLTAACHEIPHFERAALVSIAERFAIARAGVNREADLEPLVRCALHCASRDGTQLASCVFVTDAHHVVVQRFADARLLIVAQASRESNLALVMVAVARACRQLAGRLDLEALGI